MRELFLLREQHDSVFASVFPDGETIPWRPLTIGEFLDLQTRFALRAYPHAVLEDEAFKKCVLNQVFVDNMSKLPAGTVSAVAQAIMAHSGPSTLDDIEQRLVVCRHDATSVVHDMAALITQAFPAYTPDQVYAMDYDTFMTRLAQAERKLIQVGVLQQPISFTDQQDQKRPRVEKLPPPEELERAWREQQPAAPQEEQTIIGQKDHVEHLAALAGHDKVDAVIFEKQSMDDVPSVYHEYIEQMKKGEKVKIMSPEERLAALEEQKQENKKANLLMVQEEQTRIAELEAKVSKVKPKKSRKRRRSAKTK